VRSDGPTLCPNGLGRKAAFFQNVFGQPNNKSGQGLNEFSAHFSPTSLFSFEKKFSILSPRV
jgi:hypothetical protein